MTSPALRPRIPVYLLTGHLGSGKTTLLASWLRSPELAHCALIINEIGEVGLDQYTLYEATDTSALVANACICCTGLPGLATALADLFWARLERRIKPFRMVVIETTGLADPFPILKIFETDSLVQERYQPAGIVTTLSASTGRLTLARHPEASLQIKAADLIVLTKTDVAPLAEQDALFKVASALNTGATWANSGNASLNASAMLALLSAKISGCTEVNPTFHATVVDPLKEGHRHTHHAESFFIPTSALEKQALQRLLDQWISLSSPSLLRLKGVVELTDGSCVVVHWTTGDVQAKLSPFAIATDIVRAMRKGLTVIVEAGFDAQGVFLIDPI